MSFLDSEQQRKAKQKLAQLAESARVGCPDGLRGLALQLAVQAELAKLPVVTQEVLLSVYGHAFRLAVGRTGNDGTADAFLRLTQGPGGRNACVYSHLKDERRSS